MKYELMLKKKKNKKDTHTRKIMAKLHGRKWKKMLTAEETIIMKELVESTS